MKKILLFSDIPPCVNYSGGLVLKTLCSFLPEGSLQSVIVMNPALNPDIPADLNWIPTTIIDKPRDNWGSISKRKYISQPISIAMEAYNSLTVEKEIIRKTVDVAQSFQPDALWLIVEGHAIIRMESQIAKALNIPVYSLVWDPPGWWLRENHVNRFTAHNTLQRFENLLRSSKNTATASWALAEKYREFGASTIPIVASLDQNLAYEPSECPHNRDEFIITVAGQIYATSEWESLLVALSTLNWKLNGKKVILRVLSRYATMWANSAANIEFLGWRSQEETISILADSDILFCPYWFDPQFASEAQLSYPSKMTSYFAAGRPVFFLGPAYSSPAALIEAHGIGVGCYSLDQSQIITSLTRLAEDANLYSTVAKKAHQFFLENLTTQVLRERFSQFLDLA